MKNCKKYHLVIGMFYANKKGQRKYKLLHEESIVEGLIPDQIFMLVLARLTMLKYTNRSHKRFDKRWKNAFDVTNYCFSGHRCYSEDDWKNGLVDEDRLEYMQDGVVVYHYLTPSQHMQYKQGLDCRKKHTFCTYLINPLYNIKIN